MDAYITTFENGAKVMDEHPEWLVFSIRLVHSEYGFQLMSPASFQGTWITDSRLEDYILEMLGLTSVEELYHNALEIGIKQIPFFDELVIHCDYIEERDI